MNTLHCIEPFQDAYYINLDRYSDIRGSLLKYFSTHLRNIIGINDTICECFVSISEKNVFRGLHYQVPPRDSWKFVALIKGAATDFLVDCRAESPSFSQTGIVNLTSSNPVLIVIPPGYAHGFWAHDRDTSILYLTTQSYDRKYDSGINYSHLGNLLPTDVVVSERDRSLPQLNIKESPFISIPNKSSTYDFSNPVVLITGVTGFLGKNLITHLNQLYPPTCIFIFITRCKDIARSILSESLFNFGSRDVRVITIDELEFSIRHIKPASVYCFHLACSSDFTNSRAAISDLVNSIVDLPAFILSLLAESKIPTKFVTVGSMWQEYHRDKSFAFNLYAALKSSFDEVLKYHTESYDYIYGVTLMIPDTFGEGDTRPKLINLLCNSIKNNIILPVSGGDQYLDYLHVSDVVDALTKIIHGDLNQHWLMYGLSSNKPIQLKQLAHFVNSHFGQLITLGAKPYRAREVFHPWSNLNSLPNWQPSKRSDVYNFILNECRLPS